MTAGSGTPLLERDAELQVLASAIASAIGGQGVGVAVAGESGAGKSSLIAAALRDVTGVRILQGHCDPLRTPRPLGPFRELGLAAVESLLDDVHLSELSEQLHRELLGEPTVLVVEDLHWVDAASAELLRFVARRVQAGPLALVVSYRDVEIGPRHAARPLLGDFAVLDGLLTLQPGPLSIASVAALVQDTQLEPSRVHHVTGGNPFFVTEVVKDPDRPLPLSVRDAVLARVADVGQRDLEVLQLIAAAPDRLDDRVLPLVGVDLPTLRRLDETTLLARTEQGIVFRHELARQAVESTIPPGGGARLHALLLDALERTDRRNAALLVEHAVAARDTSRARTYALEAALDATKAGSHTEAAAFYEVALENLPVSAPPAERADLLLRLAFQQYMTSRLREAITNVRATFSLWEEAGDHEGLAKAHDAVAVYEYYNARRRQAESHARLAADIAQRSDAWHPYGEACATQGYLAYMRSDQGAASRYLDEAGAVAGREGLTQLELRSELLTAAAELASGDETARVRLLDRVEDARHAGWDEMASTGYSAVAALDVEQGRFRSAEQVIDEALPFSTSRDIPICRQWQTAVRSRLHLCKGHWSASLEDADEVLGSVGMPLATLWPHLVTALVPLRRGEPARIDALEAAWTLAEGLDEPLRRLPVLAAVAEHAWMAERADPRLEDAVAFLDAVSGSAGVGWAAGNLAVWLRRAGATVPALPHLGEPFRLSLENRPADAASWWRLAGDPFAEGMALTDADDPDLRMRGVQLLDRLGAVGTADRIRVELRRTGLTAVPQRPRASTRANPSGLTNRQLDVARLVARGLSNGEIATRLFISPKTADHHVSAILAKLQLPNRRAVVVQASELGLD